MSYKIAIASSNGESVNQHFGQAENFLIYEITKEKVHFIVDRHVEKASEGTEHSEEGLIRLADQLQDCKAVFVSKIGMKASRYLYQRNIKSFQVDFTLHYIFTTLLANEQKGKVNIFN